MSPGSFYYNNNLEGSGYLDPINIITFQNAKRPMEIELIEGGGSRTVLLLTELLL